MRKNLGEYRIIAKLAKGGQSQVYLAARSGPYGFFRPVVIKAIPDKFKGERHLEALFYQEASISSRFSHPHVVTIHDARSAGNDHFMVMDYVAGQTVADLAQRAFASGRGITLDETLLIGADACRGLDYVHSFEDADRERYSIVHCDISPQNLMITYGGVTRVFDFGISQVVEESGELKSEMVGGKYAYMSPEQCRGEAVDTRSDIFSLGVILYELLTGTRLFRRSNHEEVIKAITEEPITPPSQVASHLDEEIDAVIMKALAQDREDRFQSAGELRRGLEDLLAKRQNRMESLRAGLGGKVASLFAEERKEVAETLRDAREELSEQTVPVRMTTDEVEAVAGPTKREKELERELFQTEEKLNDISGKAKRATEVASALSTEVVRLQRRQNWFVAVLCIVSLAVVAIAATIHLSGDSFMSAGAAQTAEVEPEVVDAPTEEGQAVAEE